MRLSLAFQRVSGALAMGLGLLVASPVVAVDLKYGQRAPEAGLHHRLDEITYFQPHNTYEHNNKLTNWLDAGYRSLEIDVNDKGPWSRHPRGPYVSHSASPYDANCHPTTQDRLRDCLMAVKAWLEKEEKNCPRCKRFPVKLYVDMKVDPNIFRTLGSWHAWEIDHLDAYISSVLGNRMYRFRDLMHYLGWPSNPRQALKNKGWPKTWHLRSKVIVFLTGGLATGNMNNAFGRKHRSRWSTFLCPGIIARDYGKILGTISGWSSGNSKHVLCANVKAADHMENTLATSAAAKQIVHSWNAGGDFRNRNHGNMYTAYAAGSTDISFDSYYGRWDHRIDDLNLPVSKVAKRRGHPSIFILREMTSGKCVQVRNGWYYDGNELTLQNCDRRSPYQRIVYTAEGQFRFLRKWSPSRHGENDYCLDIKGGRVHHNAHIHLWDCDGGDSEKWEINWREMRIRPLKNDYLCLKRKDAHGKMFLEIEDGCGRKSGQRFEFLEATP